MEIEWNADKAFPSPVRGPWLCNPPQAVLITRMRKTFRPLSGGHGFAISTKQDCYGQMVDFPSPVRGPWLCNRQRGQFVVEQINLSVPCQGAMALQSAPGLFIMSRESTFRPLSGGHGFAIAARGGTVGDCFQRGERNTPFPELLSTLLLLATDREYIRKAVLFANRFLSKKGG